MKRRGRVLLIVHDLYQDDNLFPCGVGYLAGALKKAGALVTIYSQDIHHYSNEELAEFLLEDDFDLIGLGFLAGRFRETVLDLCKVINSCKKNGWLVLGGHGPSAIPEYVLDKTSADIIAIGESEETIVELLNCKLAKAGGIQKIPGIAYRKDGIVHINPRRQPIKNLEDIPYPAWDVFPMDRYITSIRLFRHDQNDRYMTLLTSRGCTDRCNFCYRLERGIRIRSIESVVNEMSLLNRLYGINYFFIADELFIFTKKRVTELKERLGQNNLRIKFYCNARVDVIDEEMLLILRDIGCTLINFGVESTSQKVLDLMNKRTTVDQNEKAIGLTKKIGIGMGLNFIWGNKGDTEESLRNNIAFIKKYNTYDQIRTIRPPTPFPGSDLYNEAVEEGLLAGADDFFDKFKNSDLLTINFCVVPEKNFYELLFEANKELIFDHYRHTNGDMAEADSMIDQFRRLYFCGEHKFRGARHYKGKTESPEKIIH